MNATIESIVITFYDPSDKTRSSVTIDDELHARLVGAQVHFTQDEATARYTYGYSFLKFLSKVAYFVTDYNRIARLP